MLYREIIAVCSHRTTKHINTLCGQNVEFVSVELGGTYSDHWGLQVPLNSFIMLTVSGIKNVEEPIKKHPIEYLFLEGTFSCCLFLYCVAQKFVRS